MTEKAKQKAQEIMDAIQGSSATSGFFSQVSQDELLSFTKEF